MPALLLLLASLIAAQAVPECTRSTDCRQMALDAAAREDFETFHSLAWRAVQTGLPNDPDLMFLLARAQALSGRPDDAVVMLRRLAERGIPHPEAETLDDFKRVREMAGWPELLERMRHVDAPAEPPPPPPPAPTPTPISKPTPTPTPVDPPATATPTAPIAKPEVVAPIAVPLAGITLVPPTVREPTAIAYDKVSARMIIADDSSGTLRVLSEITGNVVDLVSGGWGGGYHSNALMIDAKRGDLWVAGTRTGEAPDSIVHRLQLISGRLLYSVAPPSDAGATHFAAIALSSSSVFVLDSEGGRIFELAGAAKAMQLRITVPQPNMTGLTFASDTVAYVSHAGGIVRIDLPTKRIEDVKSTGGIPLDGIEWLGYYGNSLLAVQRRADGTMSALRLRFDRRGRTLTAVDTFGAAGAKGATLLGDTFFFVAALPGGTAVARVNLQPAR